MSELSFVYATVSGHGPWPATARALREEALPSLEAQGAHPYATFAPQFGLASNQLVWMTRWDRLDGIASTVESAVLALDAVESVRLHCVAPTARPQSGTPPRRTGLYVHRWFDLLPENVAEVVELSAVAWETFERTFEVEIIGFFRTLYDRTDTAQLMLLNWYPTLAAWEASRDFDADPESRNRFRRRSELTTATRAISTTLAP